MNDAESVYSDLNGNVGVATNNNNNNNFFHSLSVEEFLRGETS